MERFQRAKEVEESLESSRGKGQSCGIPVCFDSRQHLYVDEKDMINCTVEELKSRPSPSRLFRADRSALVKLSNVRGTIPWFAGSHKMKLASSAEADLGRTQIKRFKGTIKRWKAAR